MAASLIISVIGTAVSLAGFLQSSIGDAEDNHALIGYVIANDGAGGSLSDAGGFMPDVRAWDETAEFLEINNEAEYCEEGYTTCTTKVYTDEAPTYTLFTGNSDAICIAWTGIAFPGNNQKYGFHPGQWAQACDTYGDGGGSWYYAGTSVPGIEYDEETVYCAWVDKDGDIETTGFQVHWPEFDGSVAEVEDISYYCEKRPPVTFRTDYDPSTVYYWVPDSDVGGSVVSKTERESPPGCFRARNSTKPTQSTKRFENDTRIIKSFRPRHLASELCDRNRKAAGQSFVSYAEKQFCYMPTKTLYPFCDIVEEGLCWSDETNSVVAKGRAVAEDAPNLSHINQTVIWE